MKLNDLVPFIPAITTLVFIDAGLEDYQFLKNNININASVFVLYPEVDGVEQITQILSQHQHIQNIHIVSHGKPGKLYLGNTELNLDTLESYSEGIKTWFSSASRDSVPVLNIYGCNVAGTNTGKQFLEQLHQLTQVSIYASSNTVGNFKLGGSWELDVCFGENLLDNNISLFKPEAIASYTGIFATGEDGNYTLYDSEEGDKDTVSFNDISSNGTSLSGFKRDQQTSVDLPFNFNFYGIDYNQIVVAENGGIAFGNTGKASFRNNAKIPSRSPAVPSYSIFPLWSDLTGGQIHVKQDSEKFIIQWSNFTSEDTGDSDITFQAVLHQNSNNIDFVYKTVQDASGATIGLTGSKGSGLNYSFNQGNLDGATSIRFLGETRLKDTVTSVDFNENALNANAAIINSDVTLTDINSSDFEGGNLTISYSIGGGIEDQLSMSDNDDITVADKNVAYNGNIIGNVDTINNGVNGNSLTINFININANLAAVKALIQSLTYQNLSDTPNASRTISIIVDDGDSGISEPITKEIKVFAENDAPVNTVPGQQDINEDETFTFTGNNIISINDVDAENKSVKVKLEAINGVLNLNSTTGLTFTNSDGVDDKNIEIDGTITDINNALYGMVYKPNDNYNGAASITITTDDLGNSPNDAKTDSDTVNINIKAINDAPVNTVPNQIQTVKEDSNAGLVFNSANNNLIKIEDVDADDSKGSQVVQVTLGVANGTLTLSSTNGIKFAQNSSNGTSNFMFTGKVADINRALDGLVYRNNLNTHGADTLNIRTEDLGNFGEGVNQITESSINITVDAVNDAPINTVPKAQRVYRNKDLIFSRTNQNAITIDDVDVNEGTGLLEVTLSVSHGILTLSNTTDINFVSNSGNGQQNITISGTSNAINNALDGLRYRPNNNFNATHILTITTKDNGNFGQGEIQTNTKTVKIIASGDVAFIRKGELTDSYHMKGDLTNIIIGDFDGDGDDDFIRQEKGVWDNDDINTANVYLSNGNGTFTKKGDLTDSGIMKGDLTNIIVGDFDGDGNDDFIRQEKGDWDNDNINTANVYLSNGNGTFKKKGDLPDSGIMKGDLTNIIVGDFDGDGDDDFIRQEKGVWDNDNINTANVYLSNGNGTFTKRRDLPDSHLMKGDLSNIIVGDFDGDGDDDFIRQEKKGYFDRSNNTANVYFSNGNGTFTKKGDLTDYQDMKGKLSNIIVGDFDGDGDDDFIRQEKGVWDNDNKNTANIYLSKGDGTFTKHKDLIDSNNMKGDLTNIIVGDFDRDGNDDFIRQEKGRLDNDSYNTGSVYLSKYSVKAANIFRGKAYNGALAGATAFIDTNGNLQLDAGEFQTTTDNNGEYSFAIDPATLDRNEDGEVDPQEGQIVITGGIDTTTGLVGVIPLISAISSTEDQASTTPLTTLKTVLAQEGIAAEQVESLLNKISGFSLASLSQSLDNFDPYAAIGEDNSSGINIASGHIKVMNLLLNGTAFLKGAQYQGADAQIQVINSLGKVLQSVDSFDLSIENDLQQLFTQLTQQVNISITNEAVTAVSELVAQSNNFIDDLVEQALSRSISEVLPSINPIKKAVYSNLPEVVEKLVKGEITSQESQTQLQELLNADTFLVQYALNENRTVKVTASSSVTEGTDTKGQFIISLGEAAPTQGLKILYTLSGTAALGQDYNSSRGQFGEVKIEPGTNEAVINLEILDDSFAEKPESVTINLRYVGDGFVLDPMYQSAVLDITDNDEQNSANAQNGISLTGTFGNDNLAGEAGDDNLEGNSGDDFLEGLTGNDQLIGGKGDDTLSGGEGNDNLQGNFGNDFLQGHTGDDFLQGNSGNDTLEGNEGSDQLEGSIGDDQLQGNTGNDLLKGGFGNDVLEGNEDNDWLIGEAGEDILIGGAGVDLLNGGDGADVFYFNASNEGHDLILDFDPTQGDKIQISATGFNTDTLTDFSFLAGTLQYQGQEIALIQNNGQTYNHFANLDDIIEIVTEPTTQAKPEIAKLSFNVTNAVATSHSVDKPKITILDDIIKRGHVKVGTSFSSEFDLEFARTLAAALFGDASKVENSKVSFSEAFELVAKGSVDLASQRSTHTLARDAGLNIDFSPLYFYDHQAVVVRKDSGIKNALDLNSRTVGILEGSTALNNLQNQLNSQNVEFVSKSFLTSEELVAAYNRGEIDAYSIDRALILESLEDPENHLILDVEFSKEPITLAIPENDSQWADVVRWVNYVPIQAEEFGISSLNIDEILAANLDDNPNNDSSPAIRRFLGIEGELGAALGLPNDFAVKVIKQVGNYGEIYERHFPGIERDRNLLSADGGLLYSPPFSGDFPTSQLIDNDNRNILTEILDRGILKVGTNSKNTGFSFPNENGELTGFDIDLSRALAAAVLGNPEAVEFVTQSNAERFTNVANGIVDITIHQTTHNLVRDAKLGVDFSPTYLYTGQGILVREQSGISNLAMLNGRRVGFVDSTTSMQNLQDAIAEFGGTIIAKIYADESELFVAYEAGEIDAASHDIPLLSSTLSTFANPAEHRLLNEIISKEPLAMVIDENQSDWGDVVRWVYNALVQAEEYGITSENIDEFIANNTDNNSENDANLTIRQFLGLEGDIGKNLGLPRDFAVKAIKAVGNYGEIYNRHFNSKVLRRDSNALSSEFGLQYAFPTGKVPEYIAPRPNLQPQETPGIFTLEDSAADLSFSLNNNQFNEIVEIGIFTVEDNQGTVNGISPGTSSYKQAALLNSRVIFSMLPEANLPNGLTMTDIERDLSLDENSNFGFYLVKEQSTHDVLNMDANGKQDYEMLFSNSSQFQTEVQSDGSFVINWSDESNQISFNVKTQEQQSMEMGTKLQNESGLEVIDLSNESGSVALEVTVHREAAVDDMVILYKMEADGSVIDPVTGEKIAANQENQSRYLSAALANRVKGLDISTDNQTQTVLSSELQGGEIYAPMMIFDPNNEVKDNLANPDVWSEEVEVYFLGTELNSDGKDHIRLLGNNHFGFEDLYGGGDKDFNDLIVKFEMSSV